MNNNERVINVINGRCLPIPLETAITIGGEKIICFEDCLLYGEVSLKQFYDASERFRFWQKIYGHFDSKRQLKNPILMRKK
jgi:hypothetical protein